MEDLMSSKWALDQDLVAQLHEDTKIPDINLDAILDPSMFEDPTVLGDEDAVELDDDDLEILRELDRSHGDEGGGALDLERATNVEDDVDTPELDHHRPEPGLSTTERARQEHVVTQEAKRTEVLKTPQHLGGATGQSRSQCAGADGHEPHTGADGHAPPAEAQGGSGGSPEQCQQFCEQEKEEGPETSLTQQQGGGQQQQLQHQQRQQQQRPQQQQPSPPPPPPPPQQQRQQQQQHRKQQHQHQHQQKQQQRQQQQQSPPPLQQQQQEEYTGLPHQCQRQDGWEQAYTQLEGELQVQVKAMHTKALASKALGNKAKALQEFRQQKGLMEDLKRVRDLRVRGAPPPCFHMKEVEEKTEVTHTHLGLNELEVVVRKCSFVPPRGYSSLNCYVLLSLPYPHTSPQVQKTSCVSGLEPEYNARLKFQIERKKSFVRCLEQRRLRIEVFHYRWLLKDTLLFNCSLSLVDLLGKSDMNVVLPLQLQDGRRKSDATISLVVGVRQPLQQRDVRTTKSEVFAVEWDRPAVPLPQAPANPVPSPPARVSKVAAAHEGNNALSSPSPTAAQGAACKTANAEQQQQPPSLAPEQQQPPTHSPRHTTPPSSPSPNQPTCAGSSAVSQPCKADTQQTATYSAAAAPPPPLAEESTLSAEAGGHGQCGNEGDRVGAEDRSSSDGVEELLSRAEDLCSIAKMASNDVMEWESARLAQEIKAASARGGGEDADFHKDELAASKQEVDLRMQVLVIQVQTGKLTEEAYVAQVRAHLASLTALAMELRALVGGSERARALAATAVKHISIMKKELSG